MAAGRII